jgi:hypothetical protein
MSEDPKKLDIQDLPESLKVNLSPTLSPPAALPDVMPGSESGEHFSAEEAVTLEVGQGLLSAEEAAIVAEEEFEQAFENLGKFSEDEIVATQKSQSVSIRAVIADLPVFPEVPLAETIESIPPSAIPEQELEPLSFDDQEDPESRPTIIPDVPPEIYFQQNNPEDEPEQITRVYNEKLSLLPEFMKSKLYSQYELALNLHYQTWTENVDSSNPKSGLTNILTPKPPSFEEYFNKFLEQRSSLPDDTEEMPMTVRMPEDMLLSEPFKTESCPPAERVSEPPLDAPFDPASAASVPELVDKTDFFEERPTMPGIMMPGSYSAVFVKPEEKIARKKKKRRRRSDKA